MSKFSKIIASSLILFSGIALAGCSSNSTESVDPYAEGVEISYNAEGLPVDQYGNMKYNYITPEMNRGTAFISQFRATYPDLAGATRPDKYVLANGNKVCAEIEYKQRNEAYTMTFEEMKNFVIPRVKGGEVTREATLEEADGIVRLALNTVCPEYVALIPA